MKLRLPGLLLLIGVAILGFFPPWAAHAGNDLSASLPQGAKILQIIAEPNLDADTGEELLTLVETGNAWQVYILKNTDNGYAPIFQLDLGEAEPFVPGYTNVPYTVMQTGDINGDGVADFWLVYYSKTRSAGVLQVYTSSNGSFRNVADVGAEYDLRFTNYQGDLVIHDVNRIPNSDNLTLQSSLWKQDRFVRDEQPYTIIAKDYPVYARNRWRPQLFPGKNGPNPTAFRWCNEMLRLADQPQGRTAISSLLPEKAHLLDFIPDQALDLDTETEYIVAYLVPDPEDARWVLMKVAIADWDPVQRRYGLIPLDVVLYGLARHPEGNFYQPLHLLRGNGVDHLIVLGNAAPDKPLLQLKIFSNTGKGFIDSATFQANLFMQLFDRVAADGELFRVAAADLTKDGRVSVRVAKAAPSGEFGACGIFQNDPDRLMNPRDFKREFYSSEETEWIAGGYETPFLSTNHGRYSAVAGILPDAVGFKGNVEDYVIKHLADLRIRSWDAEDFDGDTAPEVLALMKTEDQAWPPVYRLGYFFSNGLQIAAVFVGPNIRPDERAPATGVYLNDIGKDKQKELIIIAREPNPETHREGIHLDIRRLLNGSWISVHPKEIWYDDLRMFSNGQGSAELAGFVLDPNHKPQGTVYEFIWKDGMFRLQKKLPVPGFDVYLRKNRGNQQDLLAPSAGTVKLR